MLERGDRPSPKRPSRSLARTGAVALVLAAAGLGGPRLAALQGSAPCSIDPAQVPDSPDAFVGTVVGPLDGGRVEAITKRVEARTGAPISPEYAALPRVSVRIFRRDRAFETIAAVLDGRVPRAGDRVVVLSRHRDPHARCSFVPWTISMPGHAG